MEENQILESALLLLFPWMSYLIADVSREQESPREEKKRILAELMDTKLPRPLSFSLSLFFPSKREAFLRTQRLRKT